MWTLLIIWLAGGFATVGGLKGIALVSGSDEIDTGIYISKFVQSWYAFGMLTTIILTEIGQQIDNKNEKS
jgi:hypothetical protein